MVDDQKSEQPALDDRSKRKTKQPYERPAVVWTQDLSLVSSQPCSKANAAPAARCSLLERLDRKEVFRRLLEVVVVPLAPLLWKPAMAVLNRLVNVAPVYRMVWSPTQPPWREPREICTTSL